MVILHPNICFTCIGDKQAVLFILPPSIRSFRLAKKERRGMDGGKEKRKGRGERGRERQKQVR